LHVKQCHGTPHGRLVLLTIFDVLLISSLLHLFWNLTWVQDPNFEPRRHASEIDGKESCNLLNYFIILI
jgi:hypothetical protein